MSNDQIQRPLLSLVSFSLFLFVCMCVIMYDFFINVFLFSSLFLLFYVFQLMSSFRHRFRAPHICLCSYLLSITFTLNFLCIRFVTRRDFIQIKFKENRKVCLQCLHSIKMLKRSNRDGHMKKRSDCCKDLFDNVSTYAIFFIQFVIYSIGDKIDDKKTN